MARQNNPHTVARKETVTDITDLDGQTVVQVGRSEYTVRQSDGTIIHRCIHQHIQTVDGTAWNPTMMSAKPPIYVGICQQCRNAVFKRRRSHGIVVRHKIKNCAVCGEPTCPLHRKLGSDQRWRCLRHHRMHQIGKFVKLLLLERID